MLFTLETERESSVKGFTELIVNSVRGFCMALADSVPGVSGGTVAFLLGFYDRFIHGARAARFAAVRFLLKLGAGWAIGFGLSALVLTSFFDTHIYEVSSLFMGFIVFAIPIVVREELDALRKRLPHLAFAVVGVAFVVAVTLLSPVSGEGIDVAAKSLDLGLVAYVFLAAMAAISAMVLPGISGSTLLLIFGLYVPIMGAVRATMGLDLSYLPILMVFAAGIACGMLLFVRLIRMCLERFRSQTIYAIIGMMLGSLFSITQGPLTLSEPQPAMSLDTFSIVFFLIGGAVVGGGPPAQRSAGSSCSGRAWRNPPRANALRRPHRTAATRHGSRCREGSPASPC